MVVGQDDTFLPCLVTLLEHGGQHHSVQAAARKDQLVEAGFVGVRDGKATLASTPQENRIAALLALGIWPFDNESFNLADVPATSSEGQAVTAVLARQLGYSL